MKFSAALLLFVALPSFAEERVLSVPAKPLDATFSLDGATVAIRCADARIHVLDARTGKERVSIGPLPKGAWMARWSADGRRLATAGDLAEATVWDAASGAAVRRVAVRGHAYALVLSKDGTRGAAGDAESGVVLWSEAGEERQLPHVGEIEDAAFSPDGATLATAGSDALVRIFRVADGSLVKTLDEAVHAQFALAYSRDGKRLATAGADGAVWVYDTSTWKRLARTGAGKMPGVFVSFDARGRVFAAFAPVGPGPRPTWLRLSSDGSEERGEVPGSAPILGGDADGSVAALATGENQVTLLDLAR